MMKNRNLSLPAFLFALLTLPALHTQAGDPYNLSWHTISPGGASVGGNYSVSGSVGQTGADDALAGGNYTLNGEFESGFEPGASTPIFDNTFGSESGGIGVTENTWLAGRFCLGSQAFSLDSVSLLLNSQDFAGQAGPPSTLRLQIYSADPISGKPSASIGVNMNLSGFTNPVTPPNGYGLVKWTPATPLTLSANTCYWTVLSREGGGNIGEIASVTMPTGAAGSFGKSQSGDSGATWQAPDDSYNFKMLIQATPFVPSPPTPMLAADESTAIPGGVGTFTGFPFAPSLSGDNAAFLGTGSSEQQGIYLRNPLAGVAKIVDLNTPIPNGVGNFLAFGTESGIIIVSGAEAGIIIVSGDVLFPARGSGAQQGIYLADHSNPATPIRIVDTSVLIPSGTGTFTAFQHEPAFDGRDIAFVGSGSGGQQGVYFADRMIPGNPIRLADTATAIPGGSGNFTTFPSGPALSGSATAFIGNGSGAQQGLYTVAVDAQLQTGSPIRIADTTTAIPNGSGNFTSFGVDQTHPTDPAMSANHLAFVGSGTGGQQGVYSVDRTVPGNPVRVADTATAIPGGSGAFTSFGPISLSDTDLAFLGNGSGGQQGIYATSGGSAPFKVIDLHDTIGGKSIAGLNFSRNGLSGDPITFQATFTDGSQAVYTMDIVEPLRITLAEKIGNDLRLSFTSVAGASYRIETRADLGSGSWAAVAGSTISSSGGTAQITIPGPLDEPRQFYRVVQAP